MYPWLFKSWDCSWEGDNDVDNETIAVGSNNKKTLQSTTREAEWGGERDGGGKDERTGGGGWR